MKDELLDIISGKSQVRYGAIIQAIAGYLRESTSTSKRSKDQKHLKKQEETHIEKFCAQHGLWMENVDFSCYVSEGAEQRVYLKDKRHVFKLNDAIYYNSWIDYFKNLILHNYFFADTAYELLGFVKERGILYAVVQQPFVKATAPTELENVRRFLTENGFTNTRNNDYFNAELGIILEDLHDENVLTQNGMLYFIDTVFYLTGHFWSSN
ncbi:putative polyvalent protein kinase domain-containing protein [Sphingobacterium corticibacterium]|uniref:Uncharacterized protein n=1 Tax=Sphingobacterium corticibacterium TaxID=2484746 RepID=A0A4Q6XTI4_9SPHI|nr:hypothetical protein [Sphingobacterium corticibacterium]RZF59646.1 hypothetical protein EWE74_10825 [Sphingobacterium corticibacterium]